MHLKSLKVFCDVVGRRSFSRAAAENGISQSGASQIVNTLEEHLGVKLIDRTKRPFVLTPEGEVYYEGCRKLVQRYFALEEEVKTLHEEVAGRVSVASIYSIGLSHMNRFVQSFLLAYPKANVRVQYQHPNRVYELVESDQVDLGLVSFPRSSRTIKATAWREEPMVLVCAPSHRLAARERVTLEDLHGLEMIAFDPDLEIRHEIDRALAARGVEVRVGMEFDNTETIKRAVEIDAGVSLLPEPTVDREIQARAIVARPLVGCDLKRPIGIIQRRGKELGKTAGRFMQLLLKQPDLARDIPELDEQRASGVPASGKPGTAQRSLSGIVPTGSSVPAADLRYVPEPGPLADATDSSSEIGFKEDLVPVAAAGNKSPEAAGRVAS
jgi:DNA-binding transcriptional LysR family regulator